MARNDTSSPWRHQARQMIAAALAALPPGADDKARKKAVRCPAAGDWQTSHGRKMWAKERRLALGLHPPIHPRDTPVVRVTPGMVDCGWCNNAKCIVCADARRKWSDRHSTDWAGWLRWLDVIAADPHDHVARFAFGDFLEEQGWDSQADIVRKEAEGFVALAGKGK